MRSEPLSFILRTEPEALEPRPRPTVVEAPFVQVMVTVPEPSRGVEAFVTIGSYAPKATAPVEIVQTLTMFAETLTLAVAEPARAGETARTRRARVPRAAFCIVSPSLLKTRISLLGDFHTWVGARELFRGEPNLTIGLTT